VLNETLVVVVGDHGENIGNHGLMDHQYCLYDTLLRVPLILRYPAQVPAGNTSDELVEVRDLYPTVLDLCELETPADESVSLFSLLDNSGLNGNKTREQVFAEYTVPQPDVDQLRSRTNDPDQLEFLDSLDRSLRCVRTQNWKYIRGTDGSEELFDLNSDPRETTDVSEANPFVVSELQEKLDSSFEPFSDLSGGKMEDVDTGARQRLEDLGYI
jgi:arylsulfatase A-like enzyme